MDRLPYCDRCNFVASYRSGDAFLCAEHALCADGDLDPVSRFNIWVRQREGEWHVAPEITIDRHQRSAHTLCGMILPFYVEAWPRPPSSPAAPARKCAACVKRQREEVTSRAS